MPRLIFANLLSELMISTPEKAYAKNLAPVTMRKVWMSQPGDIVITPAPIAENFKNYACEIINICPQEILTVCPQGENISYLATRLRHDAHAFALIKDKVKHADYEMLCFALDQPTFSLTKDLELALAYYTKTPSHDLLNLYYYLNTKAGFRHVAHTLGFKIPHGVHCPSKETLIENLTLLFQTYATLIIKFNRSSNGYGHWLLTKKAFVASEFLPTLHEFLTRYQQPHDFVIEEFIEITSAPSVEVIVEDDGPRLLYICEQRCVNASYAGMVTPPLHLSTKIITQLTNIGLKFGEYVYAKGFRGIFDVDACLDNNENLYVTETNFRRTAGTFIDTLAKRLLGNDYYNHHVWIQDAKLTPTIQHFDQALNLIKNADLMYSHVNKTGVILYADTFTQDHKCRYIIFANNKKTATEIEKSFMQLLKIEWRK